jgi:hypothetical protein
MSKIISDYELILKFIKGEQSCFDKLIHRHKNKVFAYISLYIRDLALAECDCGNITESRCKWYLAKSRPDKLSPALLPCHMQSTADALPFYFNLKTAMSHEINFKRRFHILLILH